MCEAGNSEKKKKESDITIRGRLEGGRNNWTKYIYTNSEKRNKHLGYQTQGGKKEANQEKFLNIGYEGREMQRIMKIRSSKNKKMKAIKKGN